VVKRVIFFLVLAALILAVPLAWASGDQEISVFSVDIQPGAQHDGYLVHVQAGNSFDIMPLELGIEIATVADNLYVVDSLEDAARLWQAEQITYIEPNYVIELLSVPNDPQFWRQWCMTSVNAQALWSSGITGDGVRIAIIDSGINLAHEDLDRRRIAPGFNYIRNNTDVMDVVGHGTKVAGIIAGVRNNGLGGAGLLSEATIIPLKVFDSERSNVSVAVRAIYDAVDRFDADVINMSFALTASATSRALMQAVNHAQANRVLMVAAAGNAGTSARVYPASHSNVVSVGAVDRFGNVPAFSQRNTTLTVTAPGAGLFTLGTNGASSYLTNSSGTSFAAPFVSAMAAVAKSVQPDITTNQFMDMLIRSAVEQGPSGFDVVNGHGTVDMLRFLAVLPGSDVGFIDIDGHWGRDSIVNMTQKGLFSGTSTGVFSPDEEMNRAMFVTVLGRLYEQMGGIIPHRNSTFADTQYNSWYSRFVAWGNTNGIVTGVGGNLFAPASPVSRQEAATILVRFASHIGETVTDSPASLAAFVDQNSISDWAKMPMSWAIDQGIITGIATPGGVKLEPTSGSTRAQVAVILERFINTVELDQHGARAS